MNDPTATSQPAAQAAPSPPDSWTRRPHSAVSFVGKEPTEEAVLAGAKAFAQGFDGPHPCKTDPCDECLDDSRRVLIAAYKVDGETSSAISDTGGDE